MSAPRVVPFAFEGEARSITVDGDRLYLWNGTDVTGLPAEDVASLIRIIRGFERVDRHRARQRRPRTGGWLRALHG